MTLPTRCLLAAAVATIALASVASADAVAPSTVPDSAVALVGDEAIKNATFRHWLNVAARSNPGTQGAFYHPPDFVSCVKRKRKASRASLAQRRTQCRQEYEGLRDQVLQFLILEKWVAGEAAARGIALSPQESEQAFQRAKKDTFPKESDFRKFLKQAGMTVADARFQIAFNTLYTKLRETAIAAVPAGHRRGGRRVLRRRTRSASGEPELRDLLVVLTRSRAPRPRAARAALERGQTFRHVARKYSVDPASRTNGGRLLGVAQGSQEEAFDKAIFRAPRGKLRGPIKTQFGYYLFKVIKITRAKQQTLAQASEAIHEELARGAPARGRRHVQRRPQDHAGGRARRVAAAISWSSAATGPIRLPSRRRSRTSTEQPRWAWIDFSRRIRRGRMRRCGSRRGAARCSPCRSGCRGAGSAASTAALVATAPKTPPCMRTMRSAASWLAGSVAAVQSDRTRHS